MTRFFVQVLTNDNKLDRHEEPQEVEDDLEERPLRSLHETPCSWGEDEGVPSSDSESADEEILVRTQVWRQVEGRREQCCDICHCRRRVEVSLSKA